MYILIATFWNNNHAPVLSRLFSVTRIVFEIDVITLLQFMCFRIYSSCSFTLLAEDFVICYICESLSHSALENRHARNNSKTIRSIFKKNLSFPNVFDQFINAVEYHCYIRNQENSSDISNELQTGSIGLFFRRFHSYFFRTAFVVSIASYTN